MVMARLDFVPAIHSKTFYCYGSVSVFTTSTAFVDMPDMSLTFNINKKSTCIIVAKIGCVDQVTYGNFIATRLLIDNVEEDSSTFNALDAAEIIARTFVTIVLSKSKELSAGSHTVKVQWCIDAGTAYNYGATYGVRSISVLAVPG